LKKKQKLALVAASAGFVLALCAWLIVTGKPMGSRIFPGGPLPLSNATPPENYSGGMKDSPGSKKPDDLASQVPSDSASILFSHLRLIGTALNAGALPYAVIVNDRTNTQSLVKRGDVIEGARIEEIQSNAVILSFSNGKATLTLDKSRSDQKQLSTDELLHEPPNPFIYSTQEDVENAWDETQNLMTQIELSQNLQNGEPSGVIIEKISSDSVFEKIGFKPGDVLVKVDDMAMNIADDAMEVYNCIRTRPDATFTVIRKGEAAPLILQYKKEMLK
jgi:general secretion pathway protein C